MSKRLTPNPVLKPADDTFLEELKLRVMVREEVAKEVERERALVKDYALLALRVVGAAFAILIGVLTVVGFTTSSGIKATATDYVKQRVDELVQRSDDNTGVKEVLNALMNRSILASGVTAVLRNGVRFRDEDLPAIEWNRLAAWAKQENTSDEDFGDILIVLAAQSESRKRNDINKFIAEMLNPPGQSPYLWMRQQPEKRSAILTRFRHPDLGAAALDIGVATDQAETLRLEALDYVGAIRFRTGISKLVGFLHEHPEQDELRREALIAAKVIAPLNPDVVKEFARLSTPPISAWARTTVVGGVISSWAGMPNGDNARYFEDDNLEDSSVTERRTAEDLKLLQACLEPSANVLDIRPQSRRDYSSEFGSFAYSFNEDWGWPLERLEKVKPYWRLLSDLARSGDTKRFVRWFPRIQNSRRYGAWVGVESIDGSTRVVTVDQGKHEQTLSSRMLANAVFTADSEPVQVTWDCASPRPCVGDLKSISGPITLQLEISRIR